MTAGPGAAGGLRPVAAPAAPFAVTSDEIRAIARLTGAPVSGLFLDEADAYDEADAPIADAVALRTLAARGLVTVADDLLAPDAVRVTAAGRAALGALLAPVALVEIEADWTGSPWIERHVVACGRSGATTVLTETGADVWEVGNGPEDLAATLRLLARVPSDPPEPPPSGGGDRHQGAGSRHQNGSGHGWGRSICVPVAVHEAADAAMERAGAVAAAAVLVTGGAGEEEAAAWAAAVEGRTASLEIRAARVPEDMDEGVDAGSVRLLLGGPLGTWAFDTEDGFIEDDPDAGEPEEDCSRMTEITLTEAAALLGALVRPGRPAAVA